jgi:hypothetical protein
MKSDIKFPTVEGVSVAVVREESNANSQVQWLVYLINNNPFDISNVTIRSKGYGTNTAGEKQETSVLRFFINSVAAGNYEQIEPLSNEVLHLYNEYWVSYFVGEQIYDKKIIFVPDSILEENMSIVPIINKNGVLHQ